LKHLAVFENFYSGRPGLCIAVYAFHVAAYAYLSTGHVTGLQNGLFRGSYTVSSGVCM